MKKGKIFLRSEQGLAELREKSYEKERRLQSLLEAHPDLLGSDQIDPDEPPRWILVQREMGVPDASDKSSHRWSLDHLFVDHEAIPTLVEVKRGENSDNRRKVVGQMLDYAANGTEHWSRDRLQMVAEETHGGAEHVDRKLREEFELDDDQTADDFWDRTYENLTDGNVRLVFLSDRIPSKLKTIIEFLNEQMKDARVYGVEVKQFVGGNEGNNEDPLQVLVPRVATGSEVTRSKKESQPGRRQSRWDEDEYFSKLAESVGNDSISEQLQRSLLDCGRELSDVGLSVTWGRGRKQGNFYLSMNGTTLLAANTRGQIYTHFKQWESGFSDEEYASLLEELEKSRAVQFDTGIVQLSEEVTSKDISGELADNDPQCESLHEWLKTATEIVG